MSKLAGNIHQQPPQHKQPSVDKRNVRPLPLREEPKAKSYAAVEPEEVESLIIHLQREQNNNGDFFHILGSLSETFFPYIYIVLKDVDDKKYVIAGKTAHPVLKNICEDFIPKANQIFEGHFSYFINLGEGHFDLTSASVPTQIFSIFKKQGSCSRSTNVISEYLSSQAKLSKEIILPLVQALDEFYPAKVQF